MSIEERCFLANLKAQILTVAADLENLTPEEAVNELVKITEQIEC